MKDLQAAYRFLKITAFHDINLPRRITIIRKPLRKAWGYYYREFANDTGKVVDRAIEVNSAIRCVDKLLRVLAHEMVHAALDHQHRGPYNELDTCDHGPAFKAVAHVVCERMGWNTRGF